MMQLTHQLLRDRFQVQENDTYPWTGWFGNRHHLAMLFNDLGYQTGAEIGVQRGLYSEALCKFIPGLKLYSIDPWVPYHLVSQRKQDIVEREARERLGKYNVNIIKRSSVDAVNDFEDGSLDFVYIDGDHNFDAVMLDLILWTPKVRIGGIVAGHDYLVAHQCGVIHAVDAYVKAHFISNLYVLTKDRCPTFFWVRE